MVRRLGRKRAEELPKKVKAEVCLDRLANEFGHRAPCLELERVEGLDLLGLEGRLVHLLNLLFSGVQEGLVGRLAEAV